MKRTVYIGHDPREQAAFSVALSSASRWLSDFVPVHGLYLRHLIDAGLYRRPMRWVDGPAGRRIMWDVISDAPMATEHACARFLAPTLAKSGWVLFMDGDVLVRADVCELFDTLDPAKALYCVHHRHEPPPGVKMDGQAQTAYARKNWSSVMALNCDHPANAALTLDLINSAPGRDLHRFCWLRDEDIGELDPAWNFLVGHTPSNVTPKVVHFTDGVPDMAGYQNCDFADEWRAEQRRHAA